MSYSSKWLTHLRASAFTFLAIVLAIVIGAFALTDLPQRFGIVAASGDEADPHAGHDHGPGEHDDHGGDAHAGHDHAGHDASQSIKLSRQARANLRLKTATVTVGPYTGYVEVPGIVTPWPGETHVSITSPLTGVINAINISRGEMIQSGDPLFTLRLTHQDLVNTQETFLSQLGQLDVEEREIERLASITRSGAVAGKTVLAREYERDKLLAGIRAARQSMLLHGLSEDQIAEIERTRTLIREVVVTAPLVEADNSLHHESLGAANNRVASNPTPRFASMQPPSKSSDEHIHVDTEFLVTQLDVRRGESVMAGQQIAQISDYSRLLIEGQAYQRDASLLRKAADTGAELQATISGAGNEVETITGLHVVYIGNEVGTQSRSLPFYVELKNEIERSEQRGDKRYVSWRYKPGQRLTVRLPQSQIKNAIVVPKDSVAEEGFERFLFVENGDHFDRVSVEVLARDSIYVAIKNDGQVWPGQTIAVSGAHQLQMAMKNQGGGAIDPHAGHNH
ncbi:efflux RND transporter periplasmic adaptor subunit [Aporhodopirellula aestuarii]|uniref:Efflux RND transporter periplasmic adaptor subunit n=1 Tax=Aporhodopirellula aestuarii TaxID=2950107 RepID=A0ABT0U886_9BACT|nr:efflux RND transporter periplasmic adaptor subunit [Aporhodopirellula aestuarii]MCM2373022.1 efflux RND transporter periplasmic adaptor subunit [Aporhodopirellula aestuarii]